MLFMKCFTDSRAELHYLTSTLFICKLRQLIYSNFHDIKREYIQWTHGGTCYKTDL